MLLQGVQRPPETVLPDTRLGGAMDIPDARQRVYNPCLPIPAAAIPTNDTRAGRVAV
jgi:hypothetical protein